MLALAVSQQLVHEGRDARHALVVGAARALLDEDQVPTVRRFEGAVDLPEGRSPGLIGEEWREGVMGRGGMV